jgi:ketosteroid isomerase-like protein
MHMVGKRTDGSETNVWARITVGLELRSGGWKIVHEHQSFPMMMDGTEKSATGLQP